MNALDISAYLGGVTAAAAILGWAQRVTTKPVRALRKDLAPLTDRNSDGESVFDEMRAQQKADSVSLRQLLDEFPKNGVPTRATVDAMKLDLATLLTKQADIVANLAEVRADVRAHQMLHRSGLIPPQGNPNRTS